MRRDVFQAIADPNRRAIISLLAEKKLPLNSIAENFEVSRPAISKHIKILTECGLVRVERIGREHFCTAVPEKLKEVADWTDYFSRFWDTKLNALKTFIETQK